MRLLLVEDSTRLRRSLSLGLRRAGYTVDETGDGIDGQWRAEEEHYDLIILDIQLPGRNGREILASLRSKGNRTHVLFLTARDTVQDRVEGLQAGADDYLVKPFAFAELLARVQALCRRSFDHKSPRVEVQDLVIDLNRLRATVSGHALDLLPREFKLLQFLALRQGEVVSRSEIEGHIYNDQRDVMSNAVESAISNLRKKLTHAGSKTLIQTKRGFGYSLTAVES